MRLTFSNRISQPSCILLVNDIADEREMYAEFLSCMGYRTLEAETTDAAWALARQFAPGVIVTDTMLNGSSGTALVTRLKKDEMTRRARVIVLTGRVYEKYRLEAVRAGADLFLGKPCLPADLLHAIRRLLTHGHLMHVSAGPARPRAARARLEWHRRPERSIEKNVGGRTS